MNLAKEKLAYELTKMIHGEEKANLAQAQAKAAFGGEGDMPEKTIPLGVTNLTGALVATGICKSNGEARRLVEQGGVSVNGEKATDFNMPLPEGDFTLFKGKKVRLKVVRA